MPPQYVALDLETTGLDPATDRIIEVGAVQLTAGGAITDRFSTLVNPGRDLSLVIERLTGIEPSELEAAPTIEDVLPRLAGFIEGRTVIGHNIGFDLAFLRAATGFQVRSALDTVEFSRLVLPRLPSHGLGAVAAELGHDAEGAHRALFDAELSASVFAGLTARLEAFDPLVRRQLASLTATASPELAEHLLAGLTDETGAPATLEPAARPTLPPPLKPVDNPSPIDVAQVRAAFGAGRDGIPGFESRQEQDEMTETVARAFNRGGHWLMEAGTGVGKSLAYLVPAALHALKNGERVVVSTNTINLQEQLLAKDIPRLRTMLQAAGIIEHGDELRAAVLKGRGNYLCRRRLTTVLGSAAADPEMGRLAASVLVWLPQTTTGDRGELNLGDLWRSWGRISAQDSDCLARKNRYVADGSCFLMRARREAEAAHIVIVNHALLLADLVAGGSAIPRYDHLVVDEAHNFEAEATRQFGETFTAQALLDLVDRIHSPGPAGVTSALAMARRAAPASLADQLDAVARLATEARGQVAPLFEALARLPTEGDDGRTAITSQVRHTPEWERLEELWAPLDHTLTRLTTVGRGVAEGLFAQPLIVENEREEVDPGAASADLNAALSRLDDTRYSLGQTITRAAGERIVWVAASNRGDPPALSSTLLEIGPLLSTELFEAKRTVIATSATLASAGSMDFAAETIGLRGASTLQLGSPFDYERNTLLAIATDLPAPSQRRFGDAVADAVVQLARASGGRGMVLCTSHAMVRQVRELVEGSLAADDILVAAQGVDASPRRLVEMLNENPRTLLVGTASLWEGVDIPGEALSLLIIPRLPFAVPTDPVHRARSEQRPTPFVDYALPWAVLRFRQGFGRLIRHRDDRGAVAVLDRRIVEQRYGVTFLHSLPGYTMHKGAVPALAAEVKAWLDR